MLSMLYTVHELIRYEHHGFIIVSKYRLSDRLSHTTLSNVGVSANNLPIECGTLGHFVSLRPRCFVQMTTVVKKGL